VLTDKDDSKKYSTVLKNIDLEVEKGQLIMVIGPVGSGKSSILKSMMGLLHKQNGNVQKNGKISYIPQESFLINNTFRENIIFGHEFDEEKYRDVIKISQLEPDLKVIKGGEYAEIGEKGLNLSGGQKQRISIARAIYADTDIVLIDDSLSALDAHVGKSIFLNVFLDKFVKRGKTVIMCTHVLEYLSYADKVVFIENGEITCQGNHNEMKESEPDYRIFIAEEERKKSSKNLENSKKKKSQVKHQASKFDFSSAVFDEIPDEDADRLSRKIQDNLIDSIAEVDFSKDVIESAREMSLRSHRSIKKSGFGNQPIIEKEARDTKAIKLEEGRLNKEEKHIKGDIKKGVFWKYFKSGGVCLFLTNQVFIILTVLAKIIVDFWVSSWTQNRFNFEEAKREFYYMLGYGLIILGMLIIGLIQSFLWATYSSKAGIKIFKELLKNVMKKPMSFFDTTPIGQILNLLGKDTDLVDGAIPNSALGVFTNSYQFVGIIILSSLSNVIMIPIIIVIFAILGFMIKNYLNLQRETKRVELLMTSPIISNIIELYNGILVFRNYDKIGYIRSLYQRNINKQSQVLLHSRYVGCMMQCYTETIMAFFIGGTFLLITLGIVNKWSFIPNDISILSVTLNWVITIPSFINFFLFRYAMFIQHMSSTERIFFNVDSSIEEGNYFMPKPKFNKNFPSKGIIEVNNIQVRYRENLPLVLNGVTFMTNENEKIGIVGRTGSGKSSLLLALTRMINVENSVFYKQVQYDQKLGLFKDIDKKKIKRPSSDQLKNNKYQLVQNNPNSMKDLQNFETRGNNM
jgi:ATP-binding cassette subfamily C (CFTR/MRP) protein 2